MISKRLVLTTAIAAALALPTASTFAQPAVAPNAAAPPAATAPRTAAPATGAAARHMTADQIQASKLIGSIVYDSGDQKIGSVKDLVLNPDGKVADVVIGLSGSVGTSEKNVGIPMGELKRGKNSHLVLSVTSDAIKQMANYDLTGASSERSGSSTPAPTSAPTR